MPSAGDQGAQTLNRSSGACPAPAPPWQCYDVPPSSTFADGDHCAKDCVQWGHAYGTRPAPGFCGITWRRCTPCPDYDYCAFTIDNPRLDRPGVPTLLGAGTPCSVHPSLTILRVLLVCRSELGRNVAACPCSGHP